MKIVIQNTNHDTLRCKAYLGWGEALYMSQPDSALILWSAANDIAEQNIGSGLASAIVKRRFQTYSAEALNNTGYVVWKLGDLSKAMEYYNRSLKLKEEMGNKKGIAATMNNIGFIYKDQGDMQRALDYFRRSLELNGQIGDWSGQSDLLNNIGLVYEELGDIPTALEHYHRSLKQYEALGSSEGLASALNNLGYVYLKQGEWSKALEYHNKSLEIRKALGNREGMAVSLINIGGVYKENGDILKALDFFKDGLKIYEELGNKKGEANALNNMGAVYKMQGETSRALVFFQRSLDLRKALGDAYGVANTLNNIADLELELGYLDSAKAHAAQSLDLGEQIGSPSRIKAAALTLKKIGTQTGNFKNALELYELYIQMSDSINNEQTQKATIRQQTKYEFEKAQLIKEQEEQESIRKAQEIRQRRDNLQYSVVLIGLLVLAATLVALGRISIPGPIIEGLIFFSFLIFFEFLLVLADPYIENWSGGAPGIKLLFNAGIATLIFPLHNFFEKKLKKRLSG